MKQTKKREAKGIKRKPWRLDGAVLPTRCSEHWHPEPTPPWQGPFPAPERMLSSGAVPARSAPACSCGRCRLEQHRAGQKAQPAAAAERTSAGASPRLLFLHPHVLTWCTELQAPSHSSSLLGIALRKGGAAPRAPLYKCCHPGQEASGWSSKPEQELCLCNLPLKPKGQNARSRE